MNGLFNVLNLSDIYFPWNFYTVSKEFIKKNTVFLNYSGDFALKLLESKCPPSLISFYKGYNESDKQALINAGANFYSSLNEIKPESLNLITSRLSPFDLNEFKGILKKGGHIIAEEYGFETFNNIFNALGLNISESLFSKENNLENKADLLRKEGFKIVFRRQVYIDRILTKDEFILLVKSLSSIYPELNICAEKAECFTDNEIEITEHRFIYTAKKVK